LSSCAPLADRGLRGGSLTDFGRRRHLRALVGTGRATRVETLGADLGRIARDEVPHPLEHQVHMCKIVVAIVAVSCLVTQIKPRSNALLL